MPARTPIRPLATARRKLAVKMIRRSRTMLALEELHRAAPPDFSELERRKTRVVAEVGAHVLGDQVVNQRDVVVGNRGVQRRVGQGHVLDVKIRARVGERLYREKRAGQ